MALKRHCLEERQWFESDKINVFVKECNLKKKFILKKQIIKEKNTISNKTVTNQLSDISKGYYKTLYQIFKNNFHH